MCLSLIPARMFLHGACISDIFLSTSLAMPAVQYLAMKSGFLVCIPRPQIRPNDSSQVLESGKMQNLLHNKSPVFRMADHSICKEQPDSSFTSEHNTTESRHITSSQRISRHAQSSSASVDTLGGTGGQGLWTNESGGIWKEGCRVGSTETRVFSAGQSLSSYENSGEVS